MYEKYVILTLFSMRLNIFIKFQKSVTFSKININYIGIYINSGFL